MNDQQQAVADYLHSIGVTFAGAGLQTAPSCSYDAAFFYDEVQS